MKPFKKQSVVWRLDGKKVPPGTPGAIKEVTESHKWYGTINRKHVPLCADYQGAVRMLKKLSSDAEPMDATERMRAGQVSMLVERGAKPVLTSPKCAKVADARGKGALKVWFSS